MRLTKIAIAVFSLALFAAFIGCSDDETTTGDDGADGAPEIMSIYPHEGMQNVPPDTMVHMKFDSPMDTSSVRLGFHMMSGPEMHRWMDSLDHHHLMGGHMTVMGHMMRWMDSAGYHGQFHWNNDLDSCWFDPDSMMMPSSDHVIYMYGDIQDREGHHMMMDEEEYDGRMIQFHTGSGQ